MKIEQTAKILAYITAIYPNIKINDMTLEAWHSQLLALDFKIALTAVKQVIATQKFTGLPAIGTIKEAYYDIEKKEKRRRSYNDNVRTLQAGMTSKQWEEGKVRARRLKEKIAKLEKGMEI